MRGCWTMYRLTNVWMDKMIKRKNGLPRTDAAYSLISDQGWLVLGDVALT